MSDEAGLTPDETPFGINFLRLLNLLLLLLYYIYIPLFLTGWWRNMQQSNVPARRQVRWKLAQNV